MACPSHPNMACPSHPNMACPSHPNMAGVGLGRAGRECVCQLADDALAGAQRRHDAHPHDQAAEGDQAAPEAEPHVGRLSGHGQGPAGHGRRAAARAGPARRCDARAPLEEANAHLRQVVRDGREVQPEHAARAAAAEL
eukprot:7216698-Prymnesium_polylepis.1